MRLAPIVALLALGALEAIALAGDAAEKRVQEWIRRLRTEPVASRRTLIAEIREEANVYKGEPPKTTDRPDLLPALEVALSDEDPQVRSDAIGALKYMRHPKALPILERALESEHETVRFFAVVGLGWLGDFADLRTSVITTLTKVRDRKEDREFEENLYAAEELVRLGAQTDAKIFEDALRQEDPCASLAANALTKLGRKDSVGLMIKALRSARPSNDHWIGLDLQKLTGETIGKDNPVAAEADAWQAWLDKNRSKLPEQVR
jgi:HEAT repeat protein